MTEFYKTLHAEGLLSDESFEKVSAEHELPIIPCALGTKDHPYLGVLCSPAAWDC